MISARERRQPLVPRELLRRVPQLVDQGEGVLLPEEHGGSLAEHLVRQVGAVGGAREADLGPFHQLGVSRADASRRKRGRRASGSLRRTTRSARSPARSVPPPHARTHHKNACVSRSSLNPHSATAHRREAAHRNPDGTTNVPLGAARPAIVRLGRERNELRDRTPRLRDHDLLPKKDTLDQPREVRLGIVDVHGCPSRQYGLTPGLMSRRGPRFVDPYGRGGPRPSRCRIDQAEEPQRRAATRRRARSRWRSWNGIVDQPDWPSEP